MRSTVIRAIVLLSEFSTRPVDGRVLTARATGSSARTPTTGARCSRSGPSGSAASGPGHRAARPSRPAPARPRLPSVGAHHGIGWR